MWSWCSLQRCGQVSQPKISMIEWYKTAAATTLKKDAHFEYLAIDTFIDGLPDGWRTSFAAVASTSLEQALSTLQVQERYWVSTGSNTTKICQLLCENLTLAGPTDLAQGAASSNPTAASNTVSHPTPNGQPQKSRSKSKRSSRRHESSSDESGDESSSYEHSREDRRKGNRKSKQLQVICLPPSPLM